ncbi:MAG: serpin family protein [Myxococcota bacterium]
MTSLRIAAVSVVAALTLLACGGEANVPAPGELVKSSKDRITQAAPQADVDAVVDGATTFAFDVYRKLPTTQENTAFSPYSVSVALSMTYPGARGSTLDAFEDVLHVTIPQDRYHRAMNTIDSALQSRGQGAQGKDGRPFRLRINNQLFGQINQHFEAPFLDTLSTEYGAGLRLLDFQNKPEPSRKAINDWVSTNTERLIPELLKEGTITSDTVLALVNTLYFNAAWKTKFDHEATQPDAFTLRDGSTVQVPMMAKESMDVNYATVGDVEVLELPYSGDEVSMVLLVPPAGKLADLEAALDGAKVRSYLAALQPRNVGVRMPKFEARAQADLKDILSALGLSVAFSGDADFSGMTGQKELLLTAVVHEAVVKTDEDGTEAAAATAVIAGRTSIPEYIEVNRAFVYLIRDRATGALLFIGRIGNPALTGS